ncbi:MAG: DUF1573 domain-containing protein [Bacteroidales bacterium]|nr:DUF1573 domain-containing protein [Bacteroidales bacterium]
MKNVILSWKGAGLLVCQMALVAMLTLTGCSSKGETVDVDLINNPNSASGYDESAKMPVITFDQDLHDFGRLSEGENISYSFHFRNTGNADLIISGCGATCGCTVASYPKNRIAPGDDGYITVSFNSSGKSGQQYQEVTVMSNAQPARAKLRITAQVGR